MSTADLAERARIWLFVPGDRHERFEHAARSRADVVVLDWEDSVAHDQKDPARDAVLRHLSRTDHACAVRINPPGTDHYHADVAALSTHGSSPRLVMLPKAEEPETIEELAAQLPSGSTIVALIESALGVSRAADIARVASVGRLALGTFDLAAELGIDPDFWPAFHGARQGLVLGSAIGGLAGPIDGVTGAVRDLGQLRRDVTAAMRLGFAGKLCIHPDQVTEARTALTPSAQTVRWAETVLQAVGGAAPDQSGVVVVDGRMVDAPVVRRAQRILSDVGRIQAIPDGPNER